MASVNPFLMDDIPDYGASQTDGASSNPFLSSDFATESTGNDNPFLTTSFNETYEIAATNPFASFATDYQATDTYQNSSWQQQPQPVAQESYNVFTSEDYSAQVAPKPIVAEQVAETRPNDLNLITPSNINDAENDFLVSSDEEASKPRRPPPPRPSMPKETQDLILSVTGALEATSHHLLDRLPPTRAPSPTAFPDFHSPSPTPDLYQDLLGSEQPELQQSNLPGFPSEDDLSLLGQAQNQPAPVAAPPPRPPPARPAPPKPAPPSIPPQPQYQHPQAQEDDMFDLFGTSKPPPPKTKDAILNLYAQPKPQPKDLLSDDLDIPIQVPAPLMGADEPAKESQPVNLLSSPVQPIQPPQPALPPQPPQPAQSVQPVQPVPPVQPVQPLQIAHPAQPKPPAQPERPPKPPLPAQPPPPPPQTVKPPLPPAPEPEPEVEEKVVQQIPSEQVDTQETQQYHESPVEIAPEEPQEPKFEESGPFEMETTQEESYIFGTGPPTEQNTAEPEAFAAPESEPFGQAVQPEPHYIFGTRPAEPAIFGTVPSQPAYEPEVAIFGTTKHTDSATTAPMPIFGQDNAFGDTSAPGPDDAFDAFAAKFEKAETEHRGGDPFDPFSGTGKPGGDVWGSGNDQPSDQQGFGGEDSFDAFWSQPPAAPQPTPNRLARTESGDSEEGGFSVFIKPKEGESYASQNNFGGPMPVLAPPPKSPVGNSAYSDNGPRFNPFDKGGDLSALGGMTLPPLSQTEPYEGGFKRSESQETPPTPLFDDDVSQPLEDFPRIHYSGDGWEMQLRQPNKKKITGQRFWKKIFVKLVYQGDNPVLQLFNLKEDKDPFQELPLQACYSVSDISAQQYDQFGKIFTIKLQYIFYKERPGVRPGQVTKAERITNKLSQFAAYAIQGDYQGVKEFGSDLKKLGLPVEHAPQISQLLKLGCMAFEDLKQFSVTIEECLFRMPVHRDRALNYKMEEVQITVVDEIHVEQDAFGHVEKQVARVRLFFLGFLSGMPDVELGVNDMWRQGKEVVGRHDIIPVVTEEWIRLEAVEFHSCIQQDEYEKTRTIKFKPPDACYIELMRFRIRPPKNRELPLQLKAVMCITGSKVELRADVLVPGFTSRKLGQIPCEDVMIRFPIPECWIYLFRVEKHFRYGSVKSAHRRTGKIKGIERFLGAVDTLEASLMEVTSGQAKYEHQHRAIVWRMPRLPKEGQGAYTTHNLVCRMQLTSYDQIPDNLADYAYVEFTMPATQASHTTVRSVSLCDSPSDNPPEKYVRQLARHEYRVGIEHTHAEETAAYVAATMTKPKPAPETVPEAAPAPAPAADSDSDSSG